MNLTAEQLSTLRHMLGINTPEKRVPEPYRNYAAVNPGDPEFAELERLGAVERYRQASDASDYDFFRCTEAGKAAAMASFRKIRYTRGKRKYCLYLSVADCCSGLSFGEFLKSPEFAEIRRGV